MGDDLYKNGNMFYSSYLKKKNHFNYKSATTKQIATFGLVEEYQ
jgi:hypothetical protein